MSLLFHQSTSIKVCDVTSEPYLRDVIYDVNPKRKSNGCPLTAKSQKRIPGNTNSR